MLLSKFQPEEVIDFTDGSALIVQVSTGAGGVAHMGGYNNSCAYATLEVCELTQ